VESLGQERIQERIQAQLQLLRQCLVRHPRVTCLTPESPDLSAGLLCFQVHGVEPRQVVEDLLTRRLITGQTPYRNSAVRLAPSILLADDEISQTTRILENYLDGH
jgi:selenocysteine lyase/cysteine desulfurase